MDVGSPENGYDNIDDYLNDYDTTFPNGLDIDFMLDKKFAEDGDLDINDKFHFDSSAQEKQKYPTLSSSSKYYDDILGSTQSHYSSVQCDNTLTEGIIFGDTRKFQIQSYDNLQDEDSEKLYSSYFDDSMFETGPEFIFSDIQNVVSALPQEFGSVQNTNLEGILENKIDAHTDEEPMQNEPTQFECVLPDVDKEAPVTQMEKMCYVSVDCENISGNMTELSNSPCRREEFEKVGFDQEDLTIFPESNKSLIIDQREKIGSPLVCLQSEVQVASKYATPEEQNSSPTQFFNQREIFPSQENILQTERQMQNSPTDSFTPLEIMDSVEGTHNQPCVGVTKSSSTNKSDSYETKDGNHRPSESPDSLHHFSRSRKEDSERSNNQLRSESSDYSPNEDSPDNSPRTQNSSGSQEGTSDLASPSGSRKQNDELVKEVAVVEQCKKLASHKSPDRRHETFSKTEHKSSRYSHQRSFETSSSEHPYRNSRTYRQYFSSRLDKQKHESDNKGESLDKYKRKRSQSPHAGQRLTKTSSAKDNGESRERSPFVKQCKRSVSPWNSRQSSLHVRHDHQNSHRHMRQSSSPSRRRRRDISNGHERNIRYRSRSRSPSRRDNRLRSPRRRRSPRKRSPPLRHRLLRRISRGNHWSPPQHRNTGLGNPGRDLYVAGFNFTTTERDLERQFSRFGRVRDVRIVRHKRSGESKGFGFLTLDGDEQADAAIKALNKKEWGGRIILVEKTKSD